MVPCMLVRTMLVGTASSVLAMFACVNTCSPAGKYFKNKKLFLLDFFVSRLPVYAILRRPAVGWLMEEVACVRERNKQRQGG